LGSWVKAHRGGTLKGASSKPQGDCGADGEQPPCRAELARVTMERDIWEKRRRSSQRASELKYAFINVHKLVWPIRVQSGAAGECLWYHQHLARRREIAQRRHLSDEALVVHISAVYAENRGAYGWPRIWRQLRAQGIRVGKQRCNGLMQEAWNSSPRQAAFSGWSPLTSRHKLADCAQPA